MDFVRNNIVGLIALVLLVGAGFVGSFLGQAEAQVPENYGELLGWGWSHNTGWISFNCESAPGDACATSPYAVEADMDSGSATFGQLSGYAWSPNLGWLSFNAADVAECGSPVTISSFQDVLDDTAGTYAVSGWAKFLSQNQTDPTDTFWNGCVSFDGVATDSSPYGLSVNVGGAYPEISGFGWGDEVVGWVDLTCESCTVVLVTNPEDDPDGTVFGCTDPDAVNYNAAAQVDDGSCSYDPNDIPGCTDASNPNYNPEATVDDGSCEGVGPVLGCTDTLALNYDNQATVDDGSCEYTVTLNLDASPNVINTNNVNNPVSLVPSLLSGFTATSCSLSNDAGVPIAGQNVDIGNFDLPLLGNQLFISDVSGVDPATNPIITYTLSCEGVPDASDTVSFLEGCTDPEYQTYNPLAIISNQAMCSNDPTGDNPGGSPIFIEI
jgi:hypothetical protein